MFFCGRHKEGGKRGEHCAAVVGQQSFRRASSMVQTRHARYEIAVCNEKEKDDDDDDEGGGGEGEGGGGQSRGQRGDSHAVACSQHHGRWQEAEMFKEFRVHGRSR